MILVLWKKLQKYLCRACCDFFKLVVSFEEGMLLLERKTNTLIIIIVCVCFLAAECGSTISNNEGVLLSPNYPMNYDNSHECVYSIQVQTGKGINTTASTFQLAQGDILKVKDTMLSLLCVGRR